MPKAQLDELVDLKSVVIDRSLPIEQRVHSYIEQIKNPYFFKVGSTPVRVSYSNSNMTVQNAFHNLAPLRTTAAIQILSQPRLS